MAGNDFFRGDDENRSRGYRPAPHLDHVFGLLADCRRRCLLQLLRDRDVPRFWLANLALDLAEFEEQVWKTDPTPADELELELHHNHLPALADADVVEYDQERGTGRYRGDPAIESLLEWERSYIETTE